MYYLAKVKPKVNSYLGGFQRYSASIINNYCIVTKVNSRSYDSSGLCCYFKEIKHSTVYIERRDLILVTEMPQDFFASLDFDLFSKYSTALIRSKTADLSDLLTNRNIDNTNVDITTFFKYFR